MEVRPLRGSVGTVGIRAGNSAKVPEESSQRMQTVSDREIRKKQRITCKAGGETPRNYSHCVFKSQQSDRFVSVAMRFVDSVLIDSRMKK
ncbi:hypothetical protein [Diaphorobacter aerolatus]|uniref:Uncharacterized protein n=1 Tax=Diaphorobacter aerolatus TaxID=1288495 RepID=A0A7H0GJ19_9BURK|nr:hypothetical protein [Diaphorobacter aerolatus]QNP48285.1 hypothetical protein H9K75_20300 [Diaphorobacter aerolatus]